MSQSKVHNFKKKHRRRITRCTREAMTGFADNGVRSSNLDVIRTASACRLTAHDAIAHQRGCEISQGVLLRWS